MLKFLAPVLTAELALPLAANLLTGMLIGDTGVIFREKPSVHGVTTAASLWITAALGMVYGVGMFSLALVGATATLMVLVALRLIYAILPRSSGLRLTIEVDAASGPDASALRDLLRAHNLHEQPLSQSYNRQTGTIEFTTSTWSRSLPDCDRLAETLRSNKAALRFSMLLLEDAGAQERAG